MEFFHIKCGGLIDTRHRKCTKCRKKWNILNFYFNTEMRLVPSIHQSTSKPLSSMTAKDFAKKLPKWPKWLRIVVSLVILVAIISLVVFLTWRF